MSEWKKYKLGNLINVKHGFAFKGEFFSDQPTQDILLTPGNFKIGGGFKADKFKYYNGDYPADYILKEGDILITMTDLSKAGDTLGYSAKIPKHSGIKYLHNQRLGLVQFKSDEIDPDFLYWVLRTKPYQFYIVGSATGSTVKHTSPTRICSYEFQAPKDIEEQRQIAQILSSLDDKIELNLQMNQTLEAMAQAIFNEWFVNFNFPGFDGELVDGLPKGWRMGVLGEMVDKLSKGTTPTQKDLGSLEVQIPFLKVKDISDIGTISKNNLELIPIEVHQNQLKRSILETNDILFSIAGTIGRVAIVDETLNFSNCNQAIAFIRLSDKNAFLEYIHLWLRSEAVQNNIKSSIVQGVQANVSLTVLNNIEVLIPNDETLCEWNNLIKPIYHRIRTTIYQIESLTQTRDTLLPKLMSGQLEVV